MPQGRQIPAEQILNEAVAYWYEGACPKTGALLRLPRTRESEAVAQQLGETLAADKAWPTEGKMYGVLLTEDATGARQILKAFSGLINGQSVWSGWVPPLPGREAFAKAEVNTIVALETLKQELIQLKSLPIYQAYTDLESECTTELAALDKIHAERKRERDRQRQENCDPQLISDLQYQSRQDGADRRRLRKQHRECLAPLQQEIKAAEQRMRAIKQERKSLSQQLQLQMHQAYQLTNFLGLSASLRSLMPQGAPTGTGECCAPKLLHHAAVLGLKPVAMAEFWWGEGKGDKQPGQFYGACETRCQPIMGFLLGGTQPQSLDLEILYEDAGMVAIDKPSGLLSVPGRGSEKVDSALMRLRSVYPEVQPVHRLDQATSGVLLFAKNAAMQRALQRCFEQRQVQKVYEAIVQGRVAADAGTIELSLWADPDRRPKQFVDEVRGKTALTKFEVVERNEHHTRVVFYPVTGRTHQLRVHAVAGLGGAIVGDRLYGAATDNQRLHLHAKELEIPHPTEDKLIQITSTVPF
ncbi:RluA family pseudouridine synthase [filamentous cyanobacterium LEGE 11480]|uniref:RNA pseudouridylate synthase n=1 Tax=Romeriopsis navalis LEGE 11480 TaxID=2777977 RepID=A0A928VRQ7_9CYAN|nr:RluA family pseudouridine synthase [Romeriopsis navalis]MBE9031751.1 RluA family pseudouridine synthase [Romeriopsis navalis LEGE 11480]